MAVALICDNCGKSFAQTYAKTETGKWVSKHVFGKKRQMFRLVIGVFQIRNQREFELPRGGDSNVDVCGDCVKELLEADDVSAVAMLVAPDIGEPSVSDDPPFVR